MLATLLLAGVCSTMPLFDMTGPVCSVEREDVECGCSECIAWDRAPVGPEISRVEVERVDEFGGLLVFAKYEQTWLDEDGNFARTDPTTLWCPIKHDFTELVEGELYQYRIRECNIFGCSDWSEPHHYRAAPYMEWSN